MSILVKDLVYIYHQGTPLETIALDGIELEIQTSRWLSIVGHTGSGKSTFAQHLNALIFPQKGEVEVEGMKVDPESKDLRKIRQKVGLVFQYPEQQLFAETVYEEVAFAPRNWGIKEDEIHERVEEALRAVGLNPSYYKRNPFHLSGGEKRRVAIASVISARPSYLVLDEPTAGLDASGRKDLLGLLADLRERGMGIILITHDLELALSCSEQIMIIEKGHKLCCGTPDEILVRLLRDHVHGLLLPETALLASKLVSEGWDVPLTSDELLLARFITEKVKS